MECGSPHEIPCTQVLELIDVFIDDELEEAQHVIIATHVSECPPCAGQVTVLQAVQAVVRRSAASDKAPAGLHSRVVASLRAVSVTVTSTAEHEGDASSKPMTRGN